MAYQTVFKRYELKYMLTTEQKQKMLEAMAPYMALDKYGRTTIRNIYFDTDNYRLIRRSIEKPVYKEKLRIRSYQKATDSSTVFVELKKKYKGVVYKRRVSMPESDAMNWICKRQECIKHSQIVREIDYFCNFYGALRPAVFLSYEREAYYSHDGGDFRVTFDDNIMWRNSDVSLTCDPYGEQILEPGKVLMEIKCSGGMPLWMAHALSSQKIAKTSFSKYGIAYTRFIHPTLNQKNKEICTYV